MQRDEEYYQWLEKKHSWGAPMHSYPMVTPEHLIICDVHKTNKLFMLVPESYIFIYVVKIK